MPRGAPDWGEYAQQDLLIKTFDLGELAVRLGCPSILERGGTIIFMDNFEDGYSRWLKTPYTNCQIVLSHKKTLAGGYSARFAYSAASTSWSLLKASIPFLYTSTYGVETLMLFNSNQISVYNGLRLIQDGVRYMYYFKLVPSTNSLYIYTPLGDTLIANDLSIDVTGNLWVFVKLIVDVEKGKYWRIKVNERSFDISAYAPYSGAIAEANNVSLAIQVNNSAAPACDLYVGSAIITVNEI